MEGNTVFLNKKFIKAFFYYFKIFIFFSPIIWTFYYIHLFGVNVPTADEWDFVVTSLQKYKGGTLSLQHFFSQHNEHRGFFPRIVLFCIALLSDYSNRAEMFVIQLFLITNIFIFYLRLKDQFSISFTKWPLWFAILPGLILSPALYTFFLWGIGLKLIMKVSFAIMSLFFLDNFIKTEIFKEKNINFLFSILCAIIASFSGACGVFVWVSGILILLCPYLNNRFGKSYHIYFMSWIILGIACWMLYFYNFVLNAHHTSPLYSLTHPVKLFRYFFVILGGFFSNRPSAALRFGLFLFIFNIFNVILIIKYKKISKYIFWISFTSFLLFVLFSISTGRLEFGVMQALSPRYTTYTIPFVVSSLIIFISIVEKNTIFKYILYPIIMLLLFFRIAKTYDSGFENGKNLSETRKVAARYLLTADSRSDDDLKLLYFLGGGHIRAKIKFLKENRLSVFR